jgi:ubiquinone/menaquinone biosynthesis C-methylase UbiE
MVEGSGDGSPAAGAESADRYVLGHSNREMERLKLQATLIDPITRMFLAEAGIAPGMRVLDIGSGVGDVAFLAAEFVGDAGVVIGVDRAPAGLAEATRRAAERSIRNVEFREGDATEMIFEQPFDAIVGRYVLMFQRDPVAMLRKLATHVRPGGVIVFHEGDWEATTSFPPAPVYDRCCRWIVESLRFSGVEPRMGLHLHSTYVEAGLRAPSMKMESVIGGKNRPEQESLGTVRIETLIRIIAEVIRTLLPEIQRSGVASVDEVEIESLCERMSNEIAVYGSVIVGRSEIGAWVRT